MRCIILSEVRLLGVENPLQNMAEILERAVDISLEKKDPKRKLERRLERKRKETASIEKSRPDEISADEKAKSRYIPSEVRERVYQRAGFHCTFRGFDGTRCSSRTGLEIEHQRPFAIYQSHDERFLRVLCCRHNEFEAECVYGADFIRGKIDEKTSAWRQPRRLYQCIKTRLFTTTQTVPSRSSILMARPGSHPLKQTSSSLRIRPYRRGLSLYILLKKTHTKLFSRVNHTTNCVHRVY